MYPVYRTVYKPIRWLKVTLILVAIALLALVELYNLAGLGDYFWRAM
jgi:hypothetical protein